MKPATHVIGETSQVRLEILGPDSASAMVEFFARNREHLGRWSPPEPEGFRTEEYWRTRLGSGRDDAARGTALSLHLVPLASSEQVIGSIGFSGIARGPFLACYLGYQIDEAWQGKNVMFEALSLAITHVFKEFKLHRIMANYMPTNERSARLLKRLDFVHEGYARDYLFLGGSWQDHVLTSLTNSTVSP